MFQGRLKGGDSTELQGYLKEVQDVSSECQGSFKHFLRKFQGYLKKVPSVSRKFQCFNEVLFCNFLLAWISSQLPEQKEGLLLYRKLPHQKMG